MERIDFIEPNLAIERPGVACETVVMVSESDLEDRRLLAERGPGVPQTPA